MHPVREASPSRSWLPRESLTVAIATFNGAQYVGEAVSSALAIADRVLVSDDGSTDQTMDVLQQFGSRIDVRANESNLGIERNYQSLLEWCETPLALFLNQDDVLYPRALDGRRWPSDTVTVLNGWNIGPRGEKNSLIYRRPPFRATLLGVYRALAVTGFFRSPSQAVFPVEAARDLGGFRVPDAEGQGAEDWMCWLRLASAGVPFELRMRPSVGYRVHDHNYSKQSASHGLSKAAVGRGLPPRPSHNARLRIRW